MPKTQSSASFFNSKCTSKRSSPIIIILVFLTCFFTLILLLTGLKNHFVDVNQHLDSDEGTGVFNLMAPIGSLNHRQAVTPSPKSTVAPPTKRPVLVVSDSRRKEKVSSKMTFFHHEKEEANNNNSVLNSSSSSFCKSDSINCYSPRCYIPSQNYNRGGCLPNPWYKNFHSEGMTHREETANTEYYFSMNSTIRNSSPPPLVLDCPSRVDQRKTHLKYLLESEAKQQEQIRKESPFKKATSTLFPKWFDWNGKCTQNEPNPSSTSSSENELKGSYDMKDGLYKLKNICIKPNGHLSGYVPRYKQSSSVFEEFFGADDVSFATKVIESPVKKLLQNYKESFQYSQEPASCYLDTKVVLFPLDHRITNIGHAYYRAHSMIRVIEAAFGKKAMMQEENVTVWYFATTNAGRRVILENQNNMNAFYEVLGTSWFNTFGPKLTPDNRPIKHDRHLPYSKNINETEFTCFKEVVVWHNGFMSERQHKYGLFPHQRGMIPHSEISRDIPGMQTSFHMHGPRSSRDAETARILDQLLRRCAELPPKRRMRKPTDPVKILFIVRSKWRRFLLQPYMIGYIGEYIRKIKKSFEEKFKHHHQFSKFFARNPSLVPFENRTYTFEVVSLASFRTFRDVISTFSNVDVVLGMYGSALTFASLLLPPGSVIFEVNTHFFRYGESNGISKNPETEFGGASLISGIHHVTFADKKLMMRLTHTLGAPGAIDILLGAKQFVDFFFNKIDCLMFPLVAPRPKKLHHHHETVILTPGDETMLEKENIHFLADDFEKSVTLDEVAYRLSLLPSGAKAKLSPGTIESIVPIPSPSCDFGETEYYRVAAQVLDGHLDQVIHQLANIELLGSEKSSASSSFHLRSIMTHSQLIADAVRSYVSPPVVKSSSTSSPKVASSTDDSTFHKSPGTSILIVEDCEARYSVLSESRFLKMLFMKADRIWIAEYAAGKFACERRSRNSHLDEKNNKKKTFANLDKINSEVRRLANSKRIGFDGKVTRDYYVNFCDYPCSGQGQFMVVLHDCTSETNCRVQQYQRDERHFVSTDVHKSRNDAEIAFQKRTSASGELRPPTATQVFQEVGLGTSETTIISFLLLNKNTANNNMKQDESDIFVSKMTTRS